MNLTEWLDAHSADLFAAPPAEAMRYITNDLRAMECERELIARGMGKMEARRLVKAWRAQTKQPPREGETNKRIRLPSPWAHAPDGWVVCEHGICRVVPTEEGPQLIRATTAPVYVSERHVDATTGDESWVVSYLEGGVWRTVEAPRDVFQAARSVVALSAQGLPVSSVTASAMVEWLELFVAENDVPTQRTTRQFGWVAGEFMPGGSLLPNASDPEGVGLLARATRPSGTREGWLDAFRAGAKFPPVLAAAACSLASPCLGFTNTPGFVYSMDGRTSAGKTTTQRYAASMWGCADELSPNSYIRTWDWTHTNRESWLCALNHLPAIVDDTRRHVGAPERLVEAVYQMAHGQGRGRNVDGRKAQEMKRWRLVTISSGEDPITSMGAAGGLRARVIQQWGSPFGGSAGDAVGLINRQVVGNYGHAGPEFIRALTAERRATLCERRDVLARGWAESGDVANRLVGYVALLGAVLWCAEEWCGWLGMDDPSQAVHLISGPLREAIRATAQEADPADRCWDDMLNWLATNPHRMSEAGVHTDRSPANGYIARRDGQEIALSSDELRGWANRQGYRLDAALRQWRTDGRLVTREPGRLTSYVALGKLRARCYIIRYTEEKSP